MVASIQARSPYSKLDCLLCNCQEKFEADDFRTAITDLLALKQIGTIEDYTKALQELQFDITMHNSHYDDLFFASTYVARLEEIGVTAEPHVPVTVDRAAVIAKIQQRALERTKAKTFRLQCTNKTQQSA